MRKSICVALSFAGAAALAMNTGCIQPDGEGDETPEDVGAAEDAIILGTENWDLLLSFEDDATHRISALYGRAVGLMGGCSGFLIDDDVFVTARHCRGASQRTVTFGRFGGDGSSSDFPEAAAEAQERALAIGIQASVVAGLPPSVLTTFTCNLVGQEHGGRDIDYYRCAPNFLAWADGGIATGPVIDYGLKPGHIWGHFNVQTGNRPVGTPVYQETVNRRCGDTVRSVLLAPGTVIDTTNSCSTDSGNFTGCFELSSDNTTGSSGGVIVDRVTQRAFGVVQSTWFMWDVDPADPCDSLPHWQAENRGSYIGLRAAELLGEDPGGNGQNVGAFVKADYGWLGTLNAPAALDCPPRMLAAGIVSTSVLDGSIGNFGLVCVPFREDAEDYRLDRATVIAGGSADTGQGLVSNMDLNTFLHERLSSAEPAPGVQGLQMCPPGTYLTRLSGFGGADVDRVVSMGCVHPPSGRTASRWLDESPAFGFAYGESPQHTTCATGAYAAGLRINAGAETTGFKIRCRYASL